MKKDKRNSSLIPRFITDEFMNSFFSTCFLFLSNSGQSYWNQRLNNHYESTKNLVANIVNKINSQNSISEFYKEVELNCITAKKNYDFWCSEEAKSRRVSYSMVNPSLFNIHNNAVQKMNESYSDLMKWKLIEAYAQSILEEDDENRHYLNDSGLKSVEELIDTSHIRDEVRKAKEAVDTDSYEAIGKAKELLEASFRFILNAKEIQLGQKEDLNSLSKKVKKCLRIEEIDCGSGSKTIISGLNGIVSGLAELRNSYGSGHGKDPNFSSLPVSFGRLAISAASTYIEFILQEYESSLTECGDHKDT